MQCPCGSKKMYVDCCGIFIEAKGLPQTPEQLMRSRYTAYATGRLDYIRNTMRGKALKIFNRGDNNRSNEPLKWLDLTIVDTPAPQNDVGIVEFKARYLLNNEIHTLHERSKFQFYKKRWFYVDRIA